MPVMTRSVHDLAHGVVARDPPAGDRIRPRRLVALRARRGGAGGREAGPHPDPGAVPRLRGQLPRGQRGRPGDRRRHHRRVARADVDRGHPQHDHDRRGDDRGRGCRDRPRRVAARAARRDRAARSRRGAMPAADRRGSSRSSGSIRRSRPATGCPSRSAGPVAGSCSAPTARRRARRPGTPSAEVDPEMLLLMPCGFHLAETSRRMGAGRRARPATRDLTAVRRGQVFAVDGSAYFSRPGPRVIDGIELLAEIFDPDAFVDVAPVGSWAPVDAEAGPMPFRATLRLPVVRQPPMPVAGRTTSRAGPSSARTASARRATTGSCASGCARR